MYCCRHTTPTRGKTTRDDSREPARLHPSTISQPGCCRQILLIARHFFTYLCYRQVDGINHWPIPDIKVANRGCSIRIPRECAEERSHCPKVFGAIFKILIFSFFDIRKGFLEDRRPSSNCDPYQVFLSGNGWKSCLGMVLNWHVHVCGGGGGVLNFKSPWWFADAHLKFRLNAHCLELVQVTEVLVKTCCLDEWTSLPSSTGARFVNILSWARLPFLGHCFDHNSDTPWHSDTTFSDKAIFS